MTSHSAEPSANTSPESEQTASEADELEGVRQGDEDITAGRTRLADEVFAEMRKQYGLSR